MGGVVGVRLGVICPCPPIRDNIVTLCHLFICFRAHGGLKARDESVICLRRRAKEQLCSCLHGLAEVEPPSDPEAYQVG